MKILEDLYWNYTDSTEYEQSKEGKDFDNTFTYLLRLLENSLNHEEYAKAEGLLDSLISKHGKTYFSAGFQYAMRLWKECD